MGRRQVNPPRTFKVVYHQARFGWVGWVDLVDLRYLIAEPSRNFWRPTEAKLIRVLSRKALRMETSHARRNNPKGIL